MRRTQIRHFIAFFCLLIAASFAQAQSGNVYSNGQTYGSVQDGTVVQSRQVVVDDTSHRDRVVGMAIGGALGALLGQKLGSKNSRSGRALAAAVGTAVGGYAGNKIASRLGSTDAQELIVQSRDGKLRSVVQPMPAQQFQPGESVRLLKQGGQVRVIQTSQSSNIGDPWDYN